MLSRVLTRSDGLSKYWFSPDDELDAALLLAGHVEHRVSGRYCFQTTYVNACYHEYYNRPATFKMVWMLRTPFSVIHSMLYNWRTTALDTLFLQCGTSILTGFDKWCYRLFGMQSISRLRRACWAYTAKTSQIFKLKRRLRPDQLMVVDYDELVTNKHTMLPAIYDFVNVPFDPKYADQLHANSVDKTNQLSPSERDTIDQMCEHVYQKARTLLAASENTPLVIRSRVFRAVGADHCSDPASTSPVRTTALALYEPPNAKPQNFTKFSFRPSHNLSDYLLQRSCDAFLLEQTELGQEYLRRAVQEDRSILDHRGKRCRETLIRCYLNAGSSDGNSLTRVFSQLPPELAWLSESRDQTVATAHLYRGVRNLISNALE